ncbi:uncharacterized protein PHACADRAFT_180137 [Phanerochaete carnosa HHB-10118-sp]|uniref:ER membrane protein complex subunit 7 beta-sandwich domain-containing protein n=1 Tax=Phanerochaete carnosa (strain HHB-10118-sp) TaxID=650164 RepID=K5VDC7_PHACS|nr:uncharacterized protein PHACADRAFT_180137 [Phanerochaete carnosa HHB-10118-sp]EKM60981.1 hypothetical protein PHACADRAFT_180137 [Phanerochaete carnosa HHB-10118-sp]
MRLPVLSLLSLACVAFGLNLQGRVQWNEHCSGADELGQAKAVLDNGYRHGSITQDGTFTIPEVPPGIYILSIISHDHVFDKLRVDVLETDTLPEVHPYVPGTPLSSSTTVTLPYPIRLSAAQRLNYYAERQGFNLLGMLNNPMMMMMLVGGGLVFAMPYIMKSLDPEALQTLEKRQAKMSTIQSSLHSGDLKSGLSALMQMGDEDATAATGKSQTESKPSGSGLKQRGGRNKKR